MLEWHVIGTFAPGVFSGHLIKRFGSLPVMLAGVVLNLACIAIALFLPGVGWNFLFTGSRTLSLTTYVPEDRNQAQAAVNFGALPLLLSVASCGPSRAAHPQARGIRGKIDFPQGVRAQTVQAC